MSSNIDGTSLLDSVSLLLTDDSILLVSTELLIISIDDNTIDGRILLKSSTSCIKYTQVHMKIWI